MQPDFLMVIKENEQEQAGLSLSPKNDRLASDLPLPQGWATFLYYVLDMRFTAKKPLLVTFSIFTNDKTPALALHYRVLPNCRIRIPFPVGDQALKAQSAFLPPHPGVFKGGIHGQPVSPDQVTALNLSVEGEGLAQAALYSAFLTRVLEDCPVVGEAAVDELGQNKKQNWPGKTRDACALVSYLKALRESARKDAAFPEGWSGYGGWVHKRFDATGWFHTAFDGRRWWLVDPEGCAFFSNGVCYGSRPGIYGLTEGLNSLHDWLPDHKGAFAPAWITADHIPQYVVRNGEEGAASHSLFSFSRANLIRAFGAEWWDAWADITSARLHRWGFNTIGVGVNEYDAERTIDFLHRARIPYVWTLRFFPLTQRKIFRDFPDVFSEEYRLRCQAFAVKELAPIKDDPYLIGYFVTNEPEWFFGDINLAERLMASGDVLASKHVFIARIRQKYGTVERLNAAWNMQYPDFEALLIPAAGLHERTPQAAEDFSAFHAELVEAYARIVSGALREADPHHLNLGMRYNHPSEKSLCGNLSCFDVFSFNRYALEPATAADRLGTALNMPVMVGEWHIGARDSGMDAWGLLYTDNVAQRAAAMGYYSEQATQSPYLIGIHYFEYNDQPLMGRFDGECYNIGLIDVCSRPYDAVVEECTRFAQRMYPLLEGQATPIHSPIPLQTIL